MQDTAFCISIYIGFDFVYFSSEAELQWTQLDRTFVLFPSPRCCEIK